MEEAMEEMEGEEIKAQGLEVGRVQMEEVAVGRGIALNRRKTYSLEW